MNSIIDKYNCVLCKYNKYNKHGDSCINHQEKNTYGYPIEKCKSLSNIYYGTVVNFFPFKQINEYWTEKTWRKEDKYNRQMEEKYGDCSLETDDYKFIWGITSWDDLTGLDACLYTMNDIDIIYNKKSKVYELGVETAYTFKSHCDEYEYLIDCLNAFTKYMDDNGLNKNKPFMLYMNNPQVSTRAKTIEELYVNFKIFVDGFCNQNIDIDTEIQ